MSWRKK